jgi:hypothetical protein
VVQSGGGGNMEISFLSQPSYSYQVEYKTNLTDAVWIPLGSTITGDGSIHSVNISIGASNCFYRMRIQ